MDTIALEPSAAVKIPCESALEAELTRKGAMLSPLELQLPIDLSEQDWAEIGRKLLRAEQVMQWWIGDWAAFGSGDENQIGWRKKGALKEFCDVNGFDYNNVRNKSWVSNSVHLSLRRTFALPWSFFQEIAALKPKDQKKWLQTSVSEALPVSELRKRIRRDDAEESGFESDGPLIKFGTKLANDLHSWLQGQSREFWTVERRAAWRRILEPLAKFWEGLA